MKKYDLISGMVLFVFGMAMFVWSLVYPFGELNSPGAGFLPRLASLVLVFLALMIVILALRKENAATKQPFFTRPEASRRLLAALAAFVSYRLLFPVIGFTASNVIFFSLITHFVGYHSWKTSIIFSLGTTIVACLVFQVWLQMQLPDPILRLF